jgi:molybdenum cofactor synthesis domain-containing protein
MSSIRFGVITLSDKAAAGQREDTSGPLIRRMLQEIPGATCVAATVLPDERHLLEGMLIHLAGIERCDLIVTTGGTGFAPRDVTPEATRAVIDREAPGLAEAMRAAGLVHTPLAMLSRGVCGLRGTTLIINCSGSPKAAREQLEVVMPVLSHALTVACGKAFECGSLREARVNA